jgi:hypothetical protein
MPSPSNSRGLLLYERVHVAGATLHSLSKLYSVRLISDTPRFFVPVLFQPKIQLETFRAWAGISSDISFYLNSHHVDLHEWILSGKARPVRVHAMAATGVARAVLGRECEDTISINATWLNLASGSTGMIISANSCVTTACLVFPEVFFICVRLCYM